MTQKNNAENPMQNNLAPINVTWMITNRCNYNCEFCFRFYERSELDFDTAKKITDKLVKAGLKKMSWAGGEPLLFPHMLDLIDYTHDQGVKTMLISNGELITDEMLGRFKSSLNWLNLPLEGASSEINERMTRKKGHFQRVVKILEKLQNTSVKLKINTVASNINIDDLIDMVPLIKNYKIRRWKIFQFYPIRGAAISSESKFSVETEKFEKVRKQILNMIDPNECMVVFENNEQLDESYFALTPDGLVYVSYKGRDIFLGDLKAQEVKEIWSHPSLDKQKYWKRSSWVLETDG